MQPTLEKESLKSLEENNKFDGTLNLDGPIKLDTPKLTPKNSFNKHKVSFTDPISNLSTIKYDVNSGSAESNNQNSDIKNVVGNININMNKNSFAVIDEKGESNCPSSMDSK